MMASWGDPWLAEPDGCDLCPQCECCPLPVCRYDLPAKAVNTLIKALAVREMTDAGYNKPQIAAVTGVSQRSLSRLKNGPLIRRYGSGVHLPLPLLLEIVERWPDKQHENGAA